MHGGNRKGRHYPSNECSGNTRQRQRLSREGSGNTRQRQRLNREGSGNTRQRQRLSRECSGDTRQRKYECSGNTRQRQLPYRVQLGPAQPRVQLSLGLSRRHRALHTLQLLQPLRVGPQTAVHTVSAARHSCGGSRGRLIINYLRLFTSSLLIILDTCVHVLVADGRRRHGTEQLSVSR